MATNEPVSLLEPVDLPLRDDDLFYIVQSGVTSTSTASRQITFLDFVNEISTISPTSIEVQVNGVPISDQSLLNFVDTASVTWANPSGGEVEATATGGSGGMAIGGAVTSGEAGKALFVDTGPVLAQEKDLGATPAASDCTASFASPTDDANVIRLGFLSGASLKGYIESARQSSTNDGYLAFITRAGASTWTEAVRIDAAQNVGIGITTPTPRLHVASQSDTTSQIRVDRLTSNVFSALGSAAAGTTGYAGTISNHPFEIRTNATVAIAVSTGQLVGIGVTPGTYRLNVVSSAGNALGVQGEIGASPGTFDTQMYIGETTDGRIVRLGFHSGGSVKAIIEAKQESTTNDGYIAFQTRNGSATMGEVMRCTSAAGVNIPGLTATRAVYTDASKNLVSAPAGANFGPSAVASITVVNGLVTAIS